ncbi:arylamine N-acetyltransferase [Bacillus haikouensis]|jgi:arylamine N-acetyltransferase|uniref:arylamine N-acetyltransferase n=1 Tax=Bacillus haikouensis TaxID=1510468 RepID=UPI00155571C0|nr:arylamine N-acetyltransferase [Bacillus haikouensis]NQD65900.1 arylamine N-acetyltransferase [Bacillus haikouensis]
MNAVERYVNYLNMEIEQPTINYLQRLIQQHLIRIPYETFSKFYYFSKGGSYVPSLADFTDHLYTKGWGGTCFTLNINFGRLLKELGFDCRYVRVNPGHLGLMISISGKKLYVDVGYGSPIMKPVELEARHKHLLHGFGEEIIFTHRDQYEFEVDRRSNGKSFVKKVIEWVPLEEKDLIKDIEASYLDTDDNITMRRITAVRFQGNQCYFLRNHTLKVMTYRNIREYQMKDLDKWREMIQEVYHFDGSSLQDSIQFLEHRNIKLFS